MDLRAQTTLRTKKLGLLMRDMRLAERRSIKECAAAIGVTPAVLRAYEEASRSPSLPELELLVYYLKVPLQRLWGDAVLSESGSPAESLDLPKLKSLRQRMIGALLRQQREQANLTLKSLAQETGIPAGHLQAYEMGEQPIPLPLLEGLVHSLDGKLDSFFDQNGPIGSWLMSQKSTDKFLGLPQEIRDFVCLPVNRPYLELAMKLSEMSKDRLRSVAEQLLDITL
jgi:transcriptional regulator with XRE-family HTH domain